jgi:hypothetical protein
MAGDRAHFPKGQEAKEAIAALNNAAGVVAGWMQTMSDDELEHLRLDLARMVGAVWAEKARRHVPARPTGDDP